METDDKQMHSADDTGLAAGRIHSEHAGHHHHHGHGHHHDEPMSPDEAVRSLLVLGQVALDAGDYESAVEAYASVLQIENNETACYNLGSLYARGLAVKRDYREAARLFHQAELLGNARARALCGKCLYDYVSEGLDAKAPVDLYAEMAVFVAQVYPEAFDQKKEVNHGLFAVASTYLNRAAYAEAAKVFRAAAEFGNDAYSQYYVASFYEQGIGLEQNDLAALYWLDRAVDNGAADPALKERDEILAAYRQSLSESAFREAMQTLAAWCESGTADMPVDAKKAAQWRELA